MPPDIVLSSLIGTWIGDLILRRFRRIAAADDPRRVDIRGKLPIEQIRDSLGEVLQLHEIPQGFKRFSVYDVRG